MDKDNCNQHRYASLSDLVEPGELNGFIMKLIHKFLLYNGLHKTASSFIQECKDKKLKISKQKSYSLDSLSQVSNSENEDSDTCEEDLMKENQNDQIANENENVLISTESCLDSQRLNNELSSTSFATQVDTQKSQKRFNNNGIFVYKSESTKSLSETVSSIVMSDHRSGYNLPEGCSSPLPKHSIKVATPRPQTPITDNPSEETQTQPAEAAVPGSADSSISKKKAEPDLQVQYQENVSQTYFINGQLDNESPLINTFEQPNPSNAHMVMPCGSEMISNATTETHTFFDSIHDLVLHDYNSEPEISNAGSRDRCLNTRFDLISYADDGSSWNFDLDFDKINNVLSTTDYKNIALLLQALRWRLTKCKEKERVFTIRTYIKNDILQMTIWKENVDHLIVHWFHTLNQESPRVLEQATARFLNTVASMKQGRLYLLKSGSGLTEMLIKILQTSEEMDDSTMQIDSITQSMILGVLRKLCPDMDQRVAMIQQGLLEYLMKYLMDADTTVSPYNLRNCARIFKNLAFVKETKEICGNHPYEILMVLEKMLQRPISSCISDVLQVLLLLLSNENIFTAAKHVKFHRILGDHSQASFGEIKKYFEKLNTLLHKNSAAAPKLIDSDKKYQREVDYLERELDHDDPLIPSQYQVSGEPMLYNEFRLINLINVLADDGAVYNDQWDINEGDMMQQTEFEYYEDTQSLFQKPTKDAIFSRESFHSRKNPRLPISYSYLKLKKKIEDKRKLDMDARRQRLFREKPRATKKDVVPPPFALDYDPNCLKMSRKHCDVKDVSNEKRNETKSSCAPNHFTSHEPNSLKVPRKPCEDKETNVSNEKRNEAKSSCAPKHCLNHEPNGFKVPRKPCDEKEINGNNEKRTETKSTCMPKHCTNHEPNILKVPRKLCEEKEKKEINVSNEKRIETKSTCTPKHCANYEPNILKVPRKPCEEKEIDVSHEKRIETKSSCVPKHCAKFTSSSSTKREKGSKHKEDRGNIKEGAIPIRKGNLHKTFESLKARRAAENTTLRSIGPYFDNIPEEDVLTNHSSDPNASVSLTSVTYAKVFSPKSLLPRTPPY